MPRFRLTALLSLVLGIGVLATPANAESPANPRPRAGECRNLTWESWANTSDRTPTVPCDQPHTALTFAVPRLPAGVSYNTMTAAQRSAWAERLCVRPFMEKVSPIHSVRARSLYSLAWFIPNAAARAEGAKWARCDLVLESRRRLKPLPAATAHRPVLAGSVPADVRRCAAVPRRLAIHVTCDEAHDMIVSKTYFWQRRSHPTPAETYAQVRRICPNASMYLAPTAEFWRAGDHVLTCYRRVP